MHISANKIWPSAIGGIALLLAVLISAAGITHWAVVEKARACLRGDEVVVIPGAVALGWCDAGAALEPQLEIANLTSSPVTITGISTPCSCVLAGSLPVTLQPYATHNLGLTIHTPEQVGRFERLATIYTSSRVSPQFDIKITGQTIAARKTSAEIAAGAGTADREMSVLRGRTSTPEHEADLAALPDAEQRERTP